MLFKLRSVIGVVVLVLLTAAAHAQKRVVAYVPNWVDLNTFSDTIDYAKLTHINIAFENPVNDSSFEFAKDNVAYWLNRGLLKSKAVLGIPFYGYGFGEAFRKGDYSYAKILATYPDAENVDQVGNTIWYNGIPTIKAKTRHVVDESLGGVMIWSLDHDVKGERSLLSVIHETLHADR